MAGGRIVVKLCGLVSVWCVYQTKGRVVGLSCRLRVPKQLKDKKAQSGSVNLQNVIRKIMHWRKICSRQPAWRQINWECKYQHVPLIFKDRYQTSGCLKFILGNNIFWLSSSDVLIILKHFRVITFSGYTLSDIVRSLFLCL